MVPTKSVQKTDQSACKQISIEKLTLHIGVGAAGDALTKAMKVLEQLTQQKPCQCKSRLTIKQFGIRKNEKIATYVTIRGKKAEKLLDAGLRVKEYELKKENFSNTGNFGFGIQEHIDLGMKYDPNTGIYGMDFYVNLGRPGFRVHRRRRCHSTIGKSHRITKEESIQWFKQKYEGLVL
ncbi:putative 60S ribosomal protein L11 [Blattamonas nauphoetae]|uniref:60S ribosomal protein L11 n=1 Tax=Blattamonas nauphoetae TaxID=2049346 RepID=A0ABQ9YFL8_9EUKA|nr:putative 60S ribosomal protein L11 [Blattamonas nauphoetae]KAK2962557.1 putative 60S ribosomal protein L11 [Blattamonas nauphoetae]KAK2964389.1 putative 60S ribosomal protein L11 [Blattamonas nauphoetae]